MRILHLTPRGAASLDKELLEEFVKFARKRGIEGEIVEKPPWYHFYVTKEGVRGWDMYTASKEFARSRGDVMVRMGMDIVVYDPRKDLTRELQR